MYWKSLTPAVLAELKRSKATGQLATVDEPCDCLDEHGNTCSDCTCDHGVRHTLCSFNSLLMFHADALIRAAEERDRMKEELEARTSLGYRRLLLRAEKAEAERDDLRRQLDEARAELKVGPNGELPECPCEKRRK